LNVVNTISEKKVNASWSLMIKIDDNAQCTKFQPGEKMFRTFGF